MPPLFPAMPVFIILLMSAIAAFAIAGAIDYFMRIGYWRAYGIALFVIAVILAFCATGLWEDATRYSWGALTPIFAILLLAGWCLVLIVRRALRNYQKDRDRD